MVVTGTYDGIKLWWWCQSAMLLMTIFNIYILCCMVRFIWWISNQNTRQPVSSYDRTTSTQMVSGHDGQDIEFTAPGRRNKYKKWMNYMCVMAASQNLLKLGLDQFKFFHAWNARSDSVCETWYDVTDIFIFGGIVYCVYGFLWIKQWVFYQNPAVEGILYSRRVILFSKVFIIVIMVLSPFLTVTNAIASRYGAGNSSVPLNDTEGLKNDSNYLGCVSVYDMNNAHDSWALLAYVAVASLFQAVLLGLFVFPLIQERIDKCKTNKTTTATCSKSLLSCFRKDNSDNSDQETKRNSLNDPTSTHKPMVGSAALSSIRRAVVWASMCVITDVTTVSIFAQMGSGNPLILVAVVTDLDLLLNVLCVIATYSRWREILFPFMNHNCCRKNKESNARRKSSVPDHRVRFSPFLRNIKKSEKIKKANNAIVAEV